MIAISLEVGQRAAPFCFLPSIRAISSRIRVVLEERIKLICVLKLAYLRLSATFATVRNQSLSSSLVTVDDLRNRHVRELLNFPSRYISSSHPSLSS